MIVDTTWLFVIIRLSEWMRQLVSLLMFIQNTEMETQLWNLTVKSNWLQNPSGCINTNLQPHKLG